MSETRCTARTDETPEPDQPLNGRERESAEVYRLTVSRLNEKEASQLPSREQQQQLTGDVHVDGLAVTVCTHTPCLPHPLSRQLFPKSRGGMRPASSLMTTGVSHLLSPCVLASRHTLLACQSYKPPPTPIPPLFISPHQTPSHHYYAKKKNSPKRPMKNLNPSAAHKYLLGLHLFHPPLSPTSHTSPAPITLFSKPTKLSVGIWRQLLTSVTSPCLTTSTSTSTLPR